MFSPQAAALVAVIRAEIQRYGQSIVPCDRLLVFVSPSIPISSQFAHIFAMAESEGWSLEFQPDGTVRFAAFSETPPQTQTDSAVENVRQPAA